MPLFDAIRRTHGGRSDEHEDTFSFLNRSAWHDAGSVRDLLESFFQRYPADERSELKNKLRTQFESAFFELFLHELLLCLGCEVDVHPKIEGTNSRPDFLVRFPSGEEVIVEAVVSNDLSDKERARDARLATLYGAIERNVSSPNFFLCLGPICNPDAVPAPERIWKFIKSKIAGLDPDLATTGLRQWTYRGAKGFELEFSVIPKSPDIRGDPNIRTIGAFPGQVRWGSSSNSLSKSIKSKATKYGNFDKPFLVVVNALSNWGIGRDDVVESLFASQGPHRASDPVWNATKNTRMSGTLVTKVWPWSVHDAPLCLYHNPFAQRPCVELPWKISQCILRDSQTKWHEGINSAELFQLPKNWPGEHP